MKFRQLAIAGIAASLLSACAWDKPYLFVTEGEQQELVAEAEAKREAKFGDDYYEAHHDGRIYVFDDFDTYKHFLAHGETPYRYMRIGAGPEGKTVVFGLTDADKKKREGVASVEMWDGTLNGAAENFYAEVLYEGRFYVFDRWADVKSFRETWEAPYRFTQIGAGPQGRTVVFVLNSGNKKKQPTALIEEFYSRH